MAKNEKPETADAAPVAENTESQNENAGRGRKKSPFSLNARAEIRVHESLESVTPEMIGNHIATLFPDYAIRQVQRSRENAKDHLPTVSIYLAPAGYEYPKESEPSNTVRIKRDEADALTSAMAAMGLDPANDEHRAQFFAAIAKTVGQ